MKKKPKFDTGFEYDEWEQEKERKKIIDDYWKTKEIKEVEENAGRI